MNTDTDTEPGTALDGLAIYHVMRRRERFEETAGTLWCLVSHAAREHPGTPRYLYLDIEGHGRPGHKNRYNADAEELIAFTRAALGPFLTDTPCWGRTDEDNPQSDDMPGALLMHADRDGWLCILTGDKNKPVRYERAGGSDE